MDCRFAHGPQPCRQCFGTETAAEVRLGDWRLTSNPGYYGSATPHTLVLGFSKGANQNRAAEVGDFDRVAFSGARHRRQEVLSVLGLMPHDRSIDTLMTAREKDFGVAALVRSCSSKLKRSVCRTTDDVILTTFNVPDTLGLVCNCASRHLRSLASTVRNVVSLAANDRYLRNTQALMKTLVDFESVNEVAFCTTNALWVYGARPSSGNAHLRAWAKGPTDKNSGYKREPVQHASRATDLLN